jgi:hypothetical protein
MKTSDKLSRIDLGGLAAVAVFGYFMVINILAVQKFLKAFFPFDAVKCLLLAHLLLLTAFYVLLIALYFIRDKASATTRSFPAKLIALTATVLPFLIPLLGGSAHYPSLANLVISIVIMLSGMAFTLAALGTLGKLEHHPPGPQAGSARAVSVCAAPHLYWRNYICARVGPDACLHS